MIKPNLSRQNVVETEPWPALPLNEWRDTHDTLHMWMQIVGKTRLALSPLVNHWWNVPLYVTARGLGTGPMPSGDREVEVEFDFLEHNLLIQASDGQRKILPLIPRTVAEFYAEYTRALDQMDIHAAIWPKPVEVTGGIPFHEDRQHSAYDAGAAHRFWRILVSTQQVFEEFRSEFLGKCSPVHFFWGSFDLAVTRFSGRKAPASAQADPITREAYSHECISHGFWPGGSWFGMEISEPIFYSYTAPAPPRLEEASIRPAEAHYDLQLKEFILPYEQARIASSPKETLLEFMHSTYDAGADLAGWDRDALERRGAGAARVG